MTASASTLTADVGLGPVPHFALGVAAREPVARDVHRDALHVHLLEDIAIRLHVDELPCADHAPGDLDEDLGVGLVRPVDVVLDDPSIRFLDPPRVLVPVLFDVLDADVAGWGAAALAGTSKVRCVS